MVLDKTVNIVSYFVLITELWAKVEQNIMMIFPELDRNPINFNHFNSCIITRGNFAEFGNH